MFHRNGKQTLTGPWVRALIEAEVHAKICSRFGLGWDADLDIKLGESWRALAPSRPQLAVTFAEKGREQGQQDVNDG
jgi:hypothetical protein